MDRKKELKAQYKSTRPEMGVFKIESRVSGSRRLYSSQNVKALINRYRFQLGVGSHPDRALQTEWNEQGKDNFDFMVLERLEYDKDESRTDYSEDLELLRMIWADKLEGGSQSEHAAGAQPGA